MASFFYNTVYYTSNVQVLTILSCFHVKKLNVKTPPVRKLTVYGTKDSFFLISSTNQSALSCFPDLAPIIHNIRLSFFTEIGASRRSRSRAPVLIDNSRNDQNQNRQKVRHHVHDL